MQAFEYNISAIESTLSILVKLDIDDDVMHTPGYDDVIQPGISLARLNARYQKMHGYVSVVVCVFGIVSNVMNIVVLSQKSMASATNFMLTALALTDMLTMASYLPYAIYFYCVATPDTRYPHQKAWIVYLLFNTNFIITCHTIAMWLTVSLAIFRYIVVCRWAGAGPGPCSIQRAKVTTLAVSVTSVIFCIPNYVMYRPVVVDDGGNSYWFATNDFITPMHEVFNYWVFGVVLKVAPCVLLTVLSALLIRGMRQAEKRRMRLKSQGHKEESRRTAEHNRTTAMLVAVVLIFAVSELPQGVLALLSGFDNSIFYKVYVPLGDVWDIIVLINSAINFLLYCIMSKQFRQSFCRVFCHRLHQTAAAPGGSSSARPVNRNAYKTIVDTQTTNL